MQKVQNWKYYHFHRQCLRFDFWRFSCLLEGFLKLSIKTLIGIILYFQSGVWSILLQGFKNLCVRLGFQRETDGQRNSNVASKKLS